jgi:hypothetical protein
LQTKSAEQGRTKELKPVEREGRKCRDKAQETDTNRE